MAPDHMNLCTCSSSLSVQADTVLILNGAVASVILPLLIIIARIAAPHVNLTPIPVPLAGIQTNAMRVFDETVAAVEIPLLVPVAPVAWPHVNLAT